jgi:hypothetical protein
MPNACHLFHLVLALKQEAQRHEIYIHCFHISGNRMTASGVDGLSHSNYDSGISLGFDVHQYMPVNISAWDIAGNALTDLCKGWMGTDYAPLLLPEGWFDAGHCPGVHICPPPLQRLH